MKPSTLGMAHLINAANPQQPQQAPGDSWQPLPKGKCTHLTLLLGGREFYIPGDVRFGVFEMTPPFPVDVPLAYCAVFQTEVDCDRLSGVTVSLPRQKLIAIAKHEGMRIFGTGFTTEIVNEPAWWAKREENI